MKMTEADLGDNTIYRVTELWYESCPEGVPSLLARRIWVSSSRVYVRDKNKRHGWWQSKVYFGCHRVGCSTKGNYPSQT